MRRFKGDRRQNFGILLITLALMVFFLRSPFPTPPTVASITREAEMRGVWLTNVASGVLFLPWGIPRAIQGLAQFNFNTLYPVVWNRGYTFYPSTLAHQETGNTQLPLLTLMHFGQDVLAEIIQQGHQRDFKVLPWFEYGLMTPRRSMLAKRHPDWLTQTQDHRLIGYDDDLAAESEQASPLLQWLNTRRYIPQEWLNPFHPEVQAFIKGMVLEVVENYDIDGIQFDDHFGMPVEMGYDPYTIALYQQENNGQLPPSDPYDPRWMGWRANKITAFMGDIYKSVKAIKPDCIISLSPHSQSFAYYKYLQNWRDWVKNGFVDQLVLQVYRSDQEKFINELHQDAINYAREQIPVSVAILSGVLTKPIPIEQIIEQVEIVREQGFTGVSFFYWESLWGYITPESPQERREGFKHLFQGR
ncbi:glycoside hydrolase family 10 protein [Spirulina subsalsa FACHB-351]|uniref:Glycoside hydrolase family 10 protein n=1 Tax=Spirulina subsalsa FACHB-351 TaxID=234711 RepID=A0ABT3LAE9_9CYAN|nr:glycoside hydrolase family 10 protein [Spirulina subsalsa]MCW6038447.1 glycoside hydrolase family 10 protein [Spirulina subsalsa FACHB-351]